MVSFVPVSFESLENQPSIVEFTARSTMPADSDSSQNAGSGQDKKCVCDKFDVWQRSANSPSKWNAAKNQFESEKPSKDRHRTCATTGEVGKSTEKAIRFISETWDFLMNEFRKSMIRR